MRRISLPVMQLLTMLILAGTPYMVWLGQSFALPLSERSVTLSSATPSDIASHSFQMTMSSTTAIGSIVFEYCDNSPLFDVACNPPAGLSLSAASLTQQTGNTGFTIDTIDSTASRLVISRLPIAAQAVPSGYVFANVINPSANDQTTYVRISTYTSTQGTGSFVDNGAVAFSTITNFRVGAYVPPFLNLCVGITVASDCSLAVGDSLDLGILSTQNARFATSQLATSTNDVSGLSLYILGTTLTSGNFIIPPANTPSPSSPGAAKFGLNLRKNVTPSVGGDPSGGGTVVPTSDYDSPNLYSLVPGSQIASSPLPTDYTRMTVSYIVNIAASQPPGVYTTTMTYLASVQF